MGVEMVLTLGPYKEEGSVWVIAWVPVRALWF